MYTLADVVGSVHQQKLWLLGWEMKRKVGYFVGSGIFFFVQLCAFILSLSADKRNLHPVLRTQVLKSNIVSDKRLRKHILVLIYACKSYSNLIRLVPDLNAKCTPLEANNTVLVLDQFTENQRRLLVKNQNLWMLLV